MQNSQEINSSINVRQDLEKVPVTVADVKVADSDVDVTSPNSDSHPPSQRETNNHTNQPTKPPTNSPTKSPTHKPTNPPTHQPNNKRTHPPNSEKSPPPRPSSDLRLVSPRTRGLGFLPVSNTVGGGPNVITKEAQSTEGMSFYPSHHTSDGFKDIESHFQFDEGTKGHPRSPPGIIKAWLSSTSARHPHRSPIRMYRLLLVMLLLLTAIVSLSFMTIVLPSQRQPAFASAELPGEDFRPAHAQFGDFLNLVLVPGHSVLISKDARQAREQDAWYLEEYQRVPGQVDSFIDHIRVGTEIALQDPKALLLFSGGETRASAGPLSEGGSYWLAANGLNWFGHEELKARALTEEHARDSFENLLFSICRFFQLTGHFPHNITVVGYEFKRARFEDHHRAAISFPRTRFSYIGTRAPNFAAAARGEMKTIKAYQEDPYGCEEFLRGKRISRDPFAIGVPYYYRMPAQLRPLLIHCGPLPYLQTQLPWE